MRVKLHDFADRHNFVGKVEKEHVVLAIAYVVASFGHWELVVAGAYLIACFCTFFTKA